MVESRSRLTATEELDSMISPKKGAKSADTGPTEAQVEELENILTGGEEGEDDVETVPADIDPEDVEDLAD